MAPYGFATARGRITLVSLRALKGNTSACFIFFDLKKQNRQLIWQVGNRYFTYLACSGKFFWPVFPQLEKNLQQHILKNLVYEPHFFRVLKFVLMYCAIIGRSDQRKFK